MLRPVLHVFAVPSSLPWNALSDIPETYLTASGSLFESFQLTPDDTLLIRGATCALGYASIQLAKALGCRVIATTHKKEKLPLLQEADQAIVDSRRLEGRLPMGTKALELVGPKTLYDKMRCTAHGGIVCNTGVLCLLRTENKVIQIS